MMFGKLFPQRIETAQGAAPLPRTRPMLRVDLDAIADNWRALNTITNNTECSAVVKADAYGLGVERVALRLLREGCRTFFVALPHEAIQLRGIIPGQEINIVCLGGVSEPPELMIEHNIIPVINQYEDLEIWTDAARTAGRRLPAVFHFDTGLNRLGFYPSEAEKLAKDTTAWQEHIDLLMIMSHLACADEPDHPLTDIQNWRFQALKEHFPGVPASLAASDGIFRGKSKHYELVRPGAALYGVNPTPERPNPMKPVVTLTAPILQLRTVEQDGPVGYSATRNVLEGQRLAVVAYGYADGLFRTASNKSEFYYNGIMLPVLGRVSMDVTILDVSDVPEDELSVGTHVTIIGQHQSVDDLAKSCGTIGYEILTSLGKRFERHYVEKDGK